MLKLCTTVSHLVYEWSQIFHIWKKKKTEVAKVLKRADSWVSINAAAAAAAAAKSLQSCLTLCNPMDGSPPGSPSLGFSRQEYWSGLPCPPPGDLPDPGIKTGCSEVLAGSLLSEPPGKP